MKKKKSYNQFCGLAKALDVVGERWTLLMIRECMLGPRRYSDLLEALQGITTNLLAARLKALEEAGVLQKVQGMGRTKAYELTERGRALEPALMAIAQWGEQFMQQPGPDERVNIGWAMVALKRRYLGCEQAWIVEYTDGTRVFQWRLGPERLDVQEGVGWRPDLRIRGDIMALRRAFFAKEAIEVLQEEGVWEVTGNEEAWHDVRRAFELSTQK